MDIILFIAIGLVIMVLFLKEFLDLKGRGLVYLIAAVGLLFGLGLFHKLRRSRMKEQIKTLEGEIKEKEKNVERLLEDFDEQKAIIEEKQRDLKILEVDTARELEEIEREKEMTIDEAREHARTASSSELLSSLSAFANQ